MSRPLLAKGNELPMQAAKYPYGQNLGLDPIVQSSKLVLCRFAVLGVLLTGSTSEADTSLTLRDAVTRGLHGNAVYATAQLDVEAAAAASVQAASTFDPVVDASVTGSRDHDRYSSAGAAQPVASTSVGVSAVLTKLFEHGGELRVGVSGQRDVTTTRVVVKSGALEADRRLISPRVEVTLREPLRGGRVAGHALRAQRGAELEATQHDRTATAAAVVRDIEQAYWQLYLAQREVTIRQEATRAAERQLQQAQAEIARGSRPRLAAAEIEEELARRREDELIATTAIGERSLALSRLMGVPPTLDLRAVDPLPPPPEGEHEQAMDTAPQLRAVHARVDASQAVLSRVEDEARWRVDASVTGSIMSPDTRYPDALGATAGFEGWSVGVALTVRAPLRDRGVKAQIAVARARVAQAQIASTDAAAQLHAQVAQLENQRTVAAQRRVALARAADLAEQNLAAEQSRWERGDTTSFEVLRRQAAVGEMKLRVERARIDELAADTALAAATGELLAMRSITLR